ncbi:hypothetical protein LguiA_029797 [Lonicera macranthoides]
MKMKYIYKYDMCVYREKKKAQGRLIEEKQTHPSLLYYCLSLFNSCPLYQFWLFVRIEGVLGIDFKGQKKILGFLSLKSFFFYYVE